MADRTYKTASDYRKEQFELVKRINSFRNELINKAIELSNKAPNVLVLGNIKAIDYIPMLPDTNNYYIIGIIDMLEKELMKEEPYIQGKLFNIT
jgi:hypothetical protein